MSCAFSVVTGLGPSTFTCGMRVPVISILSTCSAAAVLAGCAPGAACSEGCCAYAICAASSASAISVATTDDFFANTVVRVRLLLLIMVPSQVYCPSGSHISPDGRIVTPCDPNVTQFTSCVKGPVRGKSARTTDASFAVPRLPCRQGGCQYVIYWLKRPRTDDGAPHRAVA